MKLAPSAQSNNEGPGLTVITGLSERRRPSGAPHSEQQGYSPSSRMNCCPSKFGSR